LYRSNRTVQRLSAACSRVQSRSSLPGTSPSGSRSGGLADQTVALGDVRGPAGGLGVRQGGDGQVVVELVQVPTHGVPTVPLADHFAQPVRLAQPGGGTEDMADCDRAAEHRVSATWDAGPTSG